MKVLFQYEDYLGRCVEVKMFQTSLIFSLSYVLNHHLELTQPFGTLTQPPLFAPLSFYAEFDRLVGLRD